jgi:hypothetical protein
MAPFMSASHQPLCQRPLLHPEMLSFDRITTPFCFTASRSLYYLGSRDSLELDLWGGAIFETLSGLWQQWTSEIKSQDGVSAVDEAWQAILERDRVQSWRQQ